MAMGSTGGGEGLSSEINVTPLIDVLLVPPKQQTKSKTPPQAQIVLELRPDGSYAINGQPYQPNELDRAFHQIYDPRPAKLLFIKAAPNRKYIDVMQAMDIAHGAGVQVIGFTPPEQAKK